MNPWANSQKTLLRKSNCRERLPTLYLVFGRKLRPMRARQTAPYQGPGFAKTDIKLGSSRPFSKRKKSPNGCLGRRASLKRRRLRSPYPQGRANKNKEEGDDEHYNHRALRWGGCLQGALGRGRVSRQRTLLGCQRP